MEKVQLCVWFTGITGQHKLITTYHTYMNTTCTLSESISSKTRVEVIFRIVFDGEIMGLYYG
jgi:hypothetical protein